MQIYLFSFARRYPGWVNDSTALAKLLQRIAQSLSQMIEWETLLFGKSRCQFGEHLMSENAWLPIAYRSFWDVPRAFSVEYQGKLYLFESLFDENIDDFPDTFTVYRLPIELRDELSLLLWDDLVQRGKEVGKLPVSHVRFDQSKRRFIHSDAFHELEITGRW